jgi:hypothetical protein
MFGSARTAQGASGLRLIGTVLVAIALVLAVAAAIALGQLAAAKPAAPAAQANHPAVIAADRWYLEELGKTETAPLNADRWYLEDLSKSTVPAGFGGFSGPRLGDDSAGSGGSNGTRFAR